MIYLNPKTQTVKIPRVPFQKFDRDHMLDVLLACAYPGDDPASCSERKAFEQYIAKSRDCETSQKVKETLAKLTKEERELLFR